MKDNPKNWNKAQKIFREMLLAYDRHAQAMEMFRMQHGQLHSAEVAGGRTWSYEDELLNDLDEETWRRIPTGLEHSIAWHVWHLARIEDVAMNILVADSQQLFSVGGWQESLGSKFIDTGNAMPAVEIEFLSETIALPALRAYRLAVGRRTQEIVRTLAVEDCKQSVDPERIRRVRQEGAVRPEAEGLLDYWGRRTIAGLLLMPPTRHNFVHLNEVSKLKKRRG